MKEEGRGSSGGVGRRRLRDSLIVAEIALAFVLLVVSGLMMRSFFGLLNVDAGFDSTNLLTMRLPATIEQFPDPEQLNRYLREVRSAVEAVPGVRETAYSCARADAGHVLRHADAGGQPPAGRSREPGRRLLQGRQPVRTSPRSASSRSKDGCSPITDTSSSPPVLVMNERLAKRYFPDEDPIGQRILIQKIVPGKTELGDDISWEVVGVIGDEKIGGPEDTRSAGVYVSNEQTPVYGHGPERTRAA